MTVFSLTVSPATYFLKRRHDAGAERRQATVNILLGLGHVLASLDRARFGRDVMHVTTGGRRIAFMNRSLNHDFYDSLASSGKLNFLERGLRQAVQDAFRMVKMHNAYTDMVVEGAGSGGRCAKCMIRKCLRLEGSEEAMRKGIPNIMPYLEKGP